MGKQIRQFSLFLSFFAYLALSLSLEPLIASLSILSHPVLFFLLLPLR